jgi:hypothetical protein
VLQLKQDKNKPSPSEPTVSQSVSVPASPQNWTPTPRFGQAGPATYSPRAAWSPPPVHDENLE